MFVLATSNAGKVREFQALFSDVSAEFLPLSEFPLAFDVEETGSSFAENAALKATVQAVRLKEWTIAEDSGICVDALDGEPGIYSARFGGPNATDEDNNRLLLERLGATPLHARTARYACAIAVSSPDGRIVATASGECRGRLGLEGSGDGGFGYDPLFEIVEYHRSVGQLGDAVKFAISHRARAARKILPSLRSIAISF
jgi:XTP/dITP diphosphohydrolase